MERPGRNSEGTLPARAPRTAGEAGDGCQAAGLARRTPYQAPLLTVALATLVLLVALGELAYLPGRDHPALPAASNDANAVQPTRYRVIFVAGARAADIGALLAEEELSVLSGPDAEGAYVLGAADPQHPRPSAEVLRALKSRGDLVRSSGPAPP